VFPFPGFVGLCFCLSFLFGPLGDLDNQNDHDHNENGADGGEDSDDSRPDRSHVAGSG